MVLPHDPAGCTLPVLTPHSARDEKKGMERLEASQSTENLTQSHLGPRLNHEFRENLTSPEALKCNDFEPKKPVISEAAEFNLRVLKRLQQAYERDPEINLQLQFPQSYADRLHSRLARDEQNGDTPAWSSHDFTTLSLEQRLPDQSVQRHLQAAESNDIRMLLNRAYPVEVMYPLASSIRDIIAPYQHTSKENDMFDSVVGLLAASDVVHRGPIPTLRTVFRCSPGAVVKMIYDAEDYTEYTMLQFLDENAPDFPAPKPLGVLRIGQISLIFASYLPGQRLTEVWPHLGVQEKASLRGEFELVLCKLRSINRPPNQPLGGVAGEGCKDLRRHIRRNLPPVYTTADHDNFLFSNVRFGSDIYITLLRSLTTDGEAEICLSHGDFRPDNIVVQKGEDDIYTLSGLIDWEFSGFYPSHYESTKATNCLGTDETSDWYIYLPPRISPSRQPRRWLLDYVLGWLLE